MGLQTSAAVELGCSLMRSRSSVGVFAGLAVLVGAGALVEGCEGRNCGKCSPAEHALLQPAVNTYCKVLARRCEAGEDVLTLTTKKHQNLSCAVARDRINKRCFDGGDLGHQEASAAAWRAVGRWQQLLATKVLGARGR